MTTRQANVYEVALGRPLDYSRGHEALVAQIAEALRMMEEHDEDEDE